MNKIVPGLYLGSIKDSSDKKQLETHQITHILAIHDRMESAQPKQGVKYLRLNARDNAQENIKRFFTESIFFIHDARINNGNVLVHCLAGVSRSASLVTAYLMIITEMPWYDSMNAVRGAREQAGPNFGFQRQLQNFDHTVSKLAREQLFQKFGAYDNAADLAVCRELLANYKETQAKLEAITSTNSINTHSYKTYPLPYNAYKLDEESPVKKKNKTSRNAMSSKQSVAVEEEGHQVVDVNGPEIVSSKEKEEIVNKIFG